MQKILGIPPLNDLRTEKD